MQPTQKGSSLYIINMQKKKKFYEISMCLNKCCGKKGDFHACGTKI
jgi:hypothetical protein